MPLYNNNYKKNLVLYWKQFYSEYQIPNGYQVHHIKPKCTFEDKDDPRIHHPRNLIALHPDDHVAIHRNRGDKWVSGDALLTVSGRKMSDETKQKISIAKKGVFNSNGHLGLTHTEETIRKMSESQTGVRLSAETKKKLSEIRKGKRHSAATKTKISDSSKGRVCSNETRAKMSKAQKGKVMSLTARKKISDAMKGRTSPFKGKTMSEETKQKISKAKKGQLVSAETRKKLSVAAKAQWARQKENT